MDQSSLFSCFVFASSKHVDRILSNRGPAEVAVGKDAIRTVRSREVMAARLPAWRRESRWQQTWRILERGPLVASRRQQCHYSSMFIAGLASSSWCALSSIKLWTAIASSSVRSMISQDKARNLNGT